MATLTTRLSLSKPDTTDNVDIAVLNANSDKLDAAVGSFMCTSTTRPSTPFNGQQIFETDTTNQYIWSSATGSWFRLGGTPSATVVTLASATVPTGWLLCDGTQYQTSVYPELANAINYAFGGSGAVFNVPDFRGRVVVGKAASGTFAALNNNGGAETHTLSVAEMPSHNHTQDAHSHTVLLSSAAGGSSGYSRNGAGHSLENAGTTTSAQPGISSTGGGGAHNNLQPYRVANFIIKI